VDLGWFGASRAGPALATSLCAAALLAPSAQALPAALTSESLVATGVSFPFPPGGTPGDVNVTGPCDSSGPSTFQFTASGAAGGPYPGTFTETGSFTMTAPPPDGIRTLLAFDAQFSIDSPNGHVTGTKSLTAAIPGATTLCS
jgi:hypothetical protein